MVSRPCPVCFILHSLAIPTSGLVLPFLAISRHSMDQSAFLRLINATTT
jgi:hypothetical protein